MDVPSGALCPRTYKPSSFQSALACLSFVSQASSALRPPNWQFTLEPLTAIPTQTIIQVPCRLHPFARCLPGPGSFSSKSDSLDSDAPSDPGAHLLTFLHCATASSSPSCAGLFPPLPLPHSPDLCCALPPAGASSCPLPTPRGRFSAPTVS